MFRLRTTASAFDRDVLAIRAMVYGRPMAACRDGFDDDGDHYVCYQDGIPAYAVRATRASVAPIECEEHYPRQLVERFRDRLVSCGRLVRNPGVPGGFERTRDFLSACWTDLIAQGVRIEISNAIERLLPYYQAYGYIPLRVPTFRHPVWGTESHTLCLIADPALPGSVNARMPAVADPIPVSSVVLSYETSSSAVAP